MVFLFCCGFFRVAWPHPGFRILAARKIAFLKIAFLKTAILKFASRNTAILKAAFQYTVVQYTVLLKTAILKATVRYPKDPGHRSAHIPVSPSLVSEGGNGDPGALCYSYLSLFNS